MLRNFFLILISFIFISSKCVEASSEKTLLYIEQFKEIAVNEMQRTKIPASIKLAQGILESGSGSSVLSVKANNHFGIKCGGNWDGKKYYREDDDYKDGKLVESCFRKYDDAEESWIAHSDFLTRGERYKFLFKYDPSKDYKKWANGLQEAGYATSKTYSEKLIDIIERYNLNQYDVMKPCNIDKTCRIEASKDKIYIHNDIKMVFINPGETLQDIAKKHEVSINRLKKYNDLTVVSWKPQDGDRIYLQPKRSSYRGKKKYHFVEPNETMMSIAQSYGIKVEKLYQRNLMKMGEEAAPGQKVAIRGKITYKPTLVSGTSKSQGTIVKDNNQEYIEFDSKKPEATPTVTPSTPKKTTEVPASDSRSKHVVQQGETLWGISKKYNISIDQLKSWNNLSDNTISIDQVLIVSP